MQLIALFIGHRRGEGHVDRCPTTVSDVAFSVSTLSQLLIISHISHQTTPDVSTAVRMRIAQFGVRPTAAFLAKINSVCCITRHCTWTAEINKSRLTPCQFLHKSTTRREYNYILRESYRRRKMYCGHARLCVCLCVLSLIHIWRCRRSTLCRSRWSPYH